MNPMETPWGALSPFLLSEKHGEEKMVIITINGVKKEREFQNMAQALAFAYQNGDCYNAEKLEIAYAAAGRDEKTDTANTGGKPKTGGNPGGNGKTGRTEGGGVENAAETV